MATIKLFETLTSKPKTPMWVEENKCKSSPSNWKPGCNPWAPPGREAACGNLQLLFSGLTLALSLFWQLSKEGQVVLGHFLGLQFK